MDRRQDRESTDVDCRELRERHGDWLDGQLAPVEAARLHAHLVACSACASYDRIVRRSLELVREAPSIEPSAEFVLRLQHRLELVDDSVVRGARSPSGVGMAAAVAGVIALLAWSPMLVQRDDDVTEAGMRVVEAEGGADGSWVMPLRPADVRSPGGLDDLLASEPAGYDRLGGIGLWFPGETSSLLRSHASTFPGPYSPLIVSPPVHGGAVRTISTEYRRVD